MVKGLGRRDDSFLIGFVSDSYGTYAITTEEMRNWVYELIKKYDELPSYIYDLTEAKNVCEFDSMVNFPMSSSISSGELAALFGIAFKRENYPENTELNISKKHALKALKDNPQLEKRFRGTFPFIDF